MARKQRFQAPIPMQGGQSGVDMARQGVMDRIDGSNI